MILFVHGTLSTPSLWLPQIRSIVGLGKQFSDQQIINTFTIQLPGHPSNDDRFGFKDYVKYLETFQANNYAAQQRIAAQMLLHGDKAIVNALTDRRLTIIAHSVGGALSLEYAMKFPSVVRRMVLVSVPYRFNQPYLNSIKTLVDTMATVNDKSFTTLARLLPFRRWRVAADLLNENKHHKGFKSCIEYLKQFNFAKQYEVSSINQQLALNKIPTLLIGGSYDLISTPQAVRKLKFILTPNSDIIMKKKTVISGAKKQSNSIDAIIYQSGHNPMDSNTDQFCTDVIKFIKQTT